MRQKIQTIKHWRRGLRQDQAGINRTIAHLTMLVVATLAISLSNLDLAWGTISAVRLNSS